MKNIVEDLNWRYATKKFDPSKRISNEELDTIKEVLRLVPTSYGLQPLEYLIVENKTIREQLKEHSYGQSQITDASHLIVICSYKDIYHDFIDSYMENTAYTRQVELEKVLGFGDYIKKTIAPLSSKEKEEWNARQAYIALGLLLQTCAHLRIDATPMEGFNPSGYNEVLNLDQKNLNATLVIPIGHRHVEDKNQHLKKVRREMDDMFTLID